MMSEPDMETSVIVVGAGHWEEETTSTAPAGPEIEVLGYTDDGSIAVLLDGERWVVPDDPANGLRRLIGTWEAQGNIIPAFEPPLPDPFPNLEPDQFWFVVRLTGHEQELRDWVASLNDPLSPNYDPVAWAAASAKLDFAKYFERDHPLVEAAREALGMSVEQLDDLWKYAASGSNPAAV